MDILLVDDEVTALRDLARVMKKVAPEANIKEADEAEQALSLCRSQEFDVAFLDIAMPEKNGLTLAKEMKRIRPMLNIVMVTAYPQYALDAIKLYVSDYVLKPAMPEDIRKALANLRNPVIRKRKGLYVKCFGNFEVFYDGEPIRFGRTKAKEMFAYLIDRKGSSATNAELRAVLWGDEANDNEKQRKYLAQIAYELRARLEELGIADILVQSRDAYAVNPAKIPCDYYLSIGRDFQPLSQYEGEYMSQYEWALFRAGELDKELL